MNRQEIWELPTTMESFGICARGLDSSVQLLAHPSAVTPAELMDLCRQIAKFYELFHCPISVTFLAEIYKDHITAHFTRLRRHARQTDTEMTLQVSIIMPELRLTIEQVADSTHQRVSRYIINDHEESQTGSQYKGERGLDMLGKHIIMSKVIKALTEKISDDIHPLRAKDVANERKGDVDRIPVMRNAIRCHLPAPQKLRASFATHVVIEAPSVRSNVKNGLR